MTKLNVDTTCPHCGSSALEWRATTHGPNFADPTFGISTVAYLECQGCDRADFCSATLEEFLEYVNDELVPKSAVRQALEKALWPLPAIGDLVR